MGLNSRRRSLIRALNPQSTTRTMGKQTPSLYSQDDPLALAMKPSALETDEERIARVHAEAEAKLISERIDAQIQQERDSLKRKRADVKVRGGLTVYISRRLPANSSFYSGKLRAASRHCRSSFSSCTNRTPSTKSALPGGRLSTSTSSVLSATFCPLSNPSTTALILMIPPPCIPGVRQNPPCLLLAAAPAAMTLVLRKRRSLISGGV